ncbi:MAG: hypothetical protein GC159_04910 [Phycisphaera sp.]|nr:hypothetical protein [Phycisphaera sp.]
MTDPSNNPNPHATPPLRLLITAGPTREPIDAVRFISNRSSGKLGVALAQAAVQSGIRTTLLLGPVTRDDHGSSLPESPPAGLNVVRFETTDELDALLGQHFGDCDALIMTAAVTDYRPAQTTAGKLPRTGDTLRLDLIPTHDLVARCAARKRDDQLVVGFALEEEMQLDRRAYEKLRRKGLDAIVANPLATMSADDITPTLIVADGERVTPGSMSKAAFAGWLVGWVSGRFHST